MGSKRGPRYSKEEFARRGDAIYEANVRPNLKKKDDGKFVAIDIESGEFAIASRELLACDRLRTRLPDPQIWLMRIGSRTLYTFGGYEPEERMIRGLVTRFKARVALQVRGPNGKQVTIEAAVDTGFNGTLTLPLPMISSLELPWEGESSGTLADGTMKDFDIYRATVIWHGRIREVTVSALKMYPVIGMSLLDGSNLSVDVRAGGKVTIKPLRRR